MEPTALSEALQVILASIEDNPDRQVIPLREALFRYSAEDIFSPIAVPPADNSAMDGFAVCVTDVPSVLRVSQRIPAGSFPEPLVAGTAARIFTGAQIPEGANAVVIQEEVQPVDGGFIFRSVSEGQNIRIRGSDIARGERIIFRGRCLRPEDLGLLASIGLSEVPVYRPLTIAFFTTGNELREPDAGPLNPGEIYNSNRFAISAQLRALGMRSLDLGNVADDPCLIGDTLEKAAKEADCILTIGGVSAGEEDHVRGQIESRGSLTIWKLAIKPGKPMAFGKLNGTPIFGLPGNPVSSWVTFALVVKPWLIKRQGGRVGQLPRFAVCANFTSAKPTQREEFLRVKLSGSGRSMVASLSGSQSSGVLSSLSQADALAVIPPGVLVTEGDSIEVIPLLSLLDPNLA